MPDGHSRHTARAHVVPLAWATALALSSIVLGVLVARDAGLALALVALGAVVCASVLRPRALLAATVVVSCLTPTYYLIKVPGVPMQVGLGVLVAAAVVVVVSLSAGPFGVPFSRVVEPVAVLSFLWMTAYLVSSDWRIPATLSQSAIALVGPITGVMLGWLVGRLGGLRTFLRTAVVALLVVGALGVVEFALGVNPWTTYGASLVAEQQWVLHLMRLGRLRVAGAFNHPIAYGLFCAGFVVLAIGVTLRDDDVRWRVLGAIATALGLVGLLLSGSRGPTLALVAVLALLAIVRLERSFHGALGPSGFLAAAGGIAAIVALTGAANWLMTLAGLTGDSVETGNILYRGRIWEAALGFPLSELVAGTGTLSAAGPLGSFTSLDNGYVAQVVQRGMLGLAGWLFVVGTPLVNYVRSRLGRRVESRYMVYVVACILVYVLGYATVSEFGAANVVFFVVVGVAWSVQWRPSESGIVASKPLP